MAKVAVIGASGNVGSRILKELSDRGHAVTAIARNADKIATLPHVTPKGGDAHDRRALSALLEGNDAVISAVHFSASDPSILIGAVKDAGVPRYLVVGGAGSLEVAPGQKLVDQPNFPAAYLTEARAGGAFLDLLKTEKELDWTFLSPSAVIEAGERTANFRLGKDTLLSNQQGSRISYEDFAVAMVDEVEKPAHSRQRFTVGY